MEIFNDWSVKEAVFDRGKTNSGIGFTHFPVFGSRKIFSFCKTNSKIREKLLQNWGKCLTPFISVRHFPYSLQPSKTFIPSFPSISKPPQDLSTDFPPQYVLSDHHFRQICGKFQLYSSCCPSLYLSIRTRVGGLGRYFHKRMGKGNKEGTSKQFRWTKPMEHVFLEILAEEARKGNKPSNTFKSVSINRVADAISSRFQVQCDTKHVENHLRTVKNQWQIICKIRGESGFGWDDNMKMITCDRATYDATVMTATMKRLKR
ncbi:uncharacterized protein [Gossypium hirsutum]|uniref:Myb/SANT-like domain-containing protein n=1 Tax=Gossypium hirsutum TaxID=3635 RepID=A0ABM2Z5J3_GOSHI|nr:uncharacterized protein LOC107923281 [Gossypium hirsutum]